MGKSYRCKNVVFAEGEFTPFILPEMMQFDST